jgi:hypothetical protein
MQASGPEREIRNGTDRDLEEFARATLSKIGDHLDNALSLEQRAGGCSQEREVQSGADGDRSFLHRVQRRAPRAAHAPTAGRSTEKADDRNPAENPSGVEE